MKTSAEMKSDAALKMSLALKTLVFLISVAVAVAVAGTARSAAAATPTPTPAPTLAPTPTPVPTATPPPKLSKKMGEPMRLEFADGRVAVFVVDNDSRPFKTSLVLTENACANKQSATCEISFPRSTLRYALRWIKNPGVESKTVRKVNRSGSGDTATVTLEPFSSAATDFGFAKKGKTLAPDAATSPYAELKCDRSDWIPWTKQIAGRKATEIVGWDEDFELQNREFLYYRGGDAPSFNAISGRYENIQLQDAGDKILLSPPSIGHDIFSGFLFFPLVGYKLQLTFASASLADKDDRMCQAKLTINFTQIFTEFTRLFPQIGQKEWDIAPFKELIVGSYEYDRLQPFYKEETAWTYGEYR